MNMKSVRTQQQIEQSLFSLLQKKPYAEISIAEITRKADVSRTSFYRNYENKDFKVADWAVDRLLNFFKENPSTMKTLLDAGFEGSLLNLQTRYLRKLFTVYHPDLNLPDYAIAYQSGSIYMLLVWWVKQDYVTPLAELTAYAEKHIML